jgi:internalin A
LLLHARLKTSRRFHAFRRFRRSIASHTQVSDLVPLSGLRALQSIRFFYTQVGDLAPLADLQALQSINCFNTQISDLAPLAGLKALEYIDCSHTQVSDLMPLANLQALQSIRCSWTRISNLTPLAVLRGLRRLFCFNTQIQDLTPLADLSLLETIDCSRTEVSDVAAVATLPALRQIDCSFTQVHTLMPFARSASLRQVTCNGLILEDSSAPYLDVPSLWSFACWQTRINGAPAEVLSQGWDDNCLPQLRAHFTDLRDGGIESRDVKLMVQGNGGVGKSQLCRRLQGLTYDDALLSTHAQARPQRRRARGGDRRKARLSNVFDIVLPRTSYGFDELTCC